MSNQYQHNDFQIFAQIHQRPRIMCFHRIDRYAQLDSDRLVRHVIEHNRQENLPAFVRQLIDRLVQFLLFDLRLLPVHIFRVVQKIVQMIVDIFKHMASRLLHKPQRPFPHRSEKVTAKRAFKLFPFPRFPKRQKHILHHVLRILKRINEPQSVNAQRLIIVVKQHLHAIYVPAE